MIPQKVQRKFARRGRRAAFSRFARVAPATVTLWLQGRFTSARLDRLAREWRPNGRNQGDTSSRSDDIGPAAVNASEASSQRST